MDKLVLTLLEKAAQARQETTVAQLARKLEIETPATVRTAYTGQEPQFVRLEEAFNRFFDDAPVAVLGHYVQLEAAVSQLQIWWEMQRPDEDDVMAMATWSDFSEVIAALLADVSSTATAVEQMIKFQADGKGGCCPTCGSWAIKNRFTVPTPKCPACQAKAAKALEGMRAALKAGTQSV